MYPSDPDYSIEGVSIRYLAENELEVALEEKQKWKVFDGTSHNLATALVYQDQYWQIYEQSMYEHGWVYYCRPWPELSKVYERVFLEPQKWRDVKYGNEQTELYDRRTEFHFFLYEILLGLFPGRWQVWLSDNWASYSTERATVISAFCNLFLAGFFYLILWPIAVLIILDSVIRVALIIAEFEAIGFLPFQVLDWLLYFIYSPFLPEDWQV